MRPANRVRLVLAGVAAVAAVAVGWSVLGKAPASLPPAPTVRAVAVSVAPARQQDFPLTAHSIGRVTAIASVSLKARVSGLLQETLFREGQMVSAGEVLFRLDRAPYEIALRQAEAALERDQAQLASVRADVGRYGSLSQKGYASTQQLEQTTAQARALAATVAADQAAVDLARLNLSYTEVRAPISGKTGAVRVHPGNLVNDSAALVDLATLSPIRIAFSLPQQDIPLVQAAMAGGAVQAVINDRIVATVDFVAPQVDAATGTVELRATTANQDLRLVPGEFVQVAVRLGSLPQAMIVPQEAINAGQHGAYLYVINGQQTAEMRRIKVLRQDGTQVAVATADGDSGPALAAGDRVVTDGQLGLAPGLPVTVVSPSAGDPAPADGTEKK